MTMKIQRKDLLNYFVEGLLTHLERRKALEHRIINEIFKEETVVVKSKNYILRQLFPVGKGK